MLDNMKTSTKIAGATTIATTGVSAVTASAVLGTSASTIMSATASTYVASLATVAGASGTVGAAATSSGLAAIGSIVGGRNGCGNSNNRCFTIRFSRSSWIWIIQIVRGLKLIFKNIGCLYIFQR